MNKKAILISVAITTFILGTVAAVVKANANAAESARIQQLEQLLAEKETEYSQTIEEANARLTVANKLLNGTGETTKDVPLKYTVSIPQAVEIAMRAGLLPMTSSGKAELVDYSGTPAYDVHFENGEQFYIDADNGVVLYNSLVGGPGTVVPVEKALAAAAEALPGGVIVDQQVSVFNELPAYAFTFSRGDQVWVGMNGAVLSIIQVQTVSTGSYESASTTAKTSKKAKSSSRGDDDHESEDHEEEDDD